MRAWRLVYSTASSEPGRPLPEPFRTLESKGVYLRKGQTMMIAGPPGSQKSALALYLAVKSGLDVVYVAADIPQQLLVSRLAAMLSGKTTKEVERDFYAGADDWYAERISALPLEVHMESAPGMDDIDEIIEAHVELWDKYPDMVVIDNLVNLQAPGEDEWAGLRWLMLSVQDRARETGAAFVVLHHMQEGTGDLTRPLPRKSLQGKVSQIPELILSVALDGDRFGVCVVKNNAGPSDPGAKSPVDFRADAERNTFSAWTSHAYSGGGYWDD